MGLIRLKVVLYGLLLLMIVFAGVSIGTGVDNQQELNTTLDGLEGNLSETQAEIAPEKDASTVERIYLNLVISLIDGVYWTIDVTARVSYHYL